MDTLHCQENNTAPVQQTTHPREYQCLRTESTSKAQSHQCWGTGNGHGALHLLVLDMVVGQMGRVVGRSPVVLKVTSGVWAELVLGEEGSMPGQSKVMLELSEEVQDAPTAGDRPSLNEGTNVKAPRYLPSIPTGICHPALQGLHGCTHP